MNTYNKNLDYLAYSRGYTFGKLEELLAIPKVRIMEPNPAELIKVADFFDINIDTLLRKEIKQLDEYHQKNIRLIILDVDGTMTDGGMYFTENGDQIKKYNTKDGMAINRATKKGIKFGIISHGHKLNMVQDRAKLLNIEKVYVGQDPKIDVLENWCKELNISKQQVAFVGDDVNDAEIMESVGLSACPSDAVKDIKSIASIILSKPGGKGCVREFIDEWIKYEE
jgi:3-deoxy-D-manno-octulosonate 8-phosphate phosphatase (KDO 8-P phosphatase)